MSGSTEERMLEAVGEAVRAMPAGHITSLAAAIVETPQFTGEASGSVLAAVAAPTYRYHVRTFLEAWREAPAVSGQALALALRAAARAREAAHREESLEIVWTGPSSHAVPVRRTREVLLDLIRLAESQLLVVSFAAYRVPEVLAALKTAGARGVDVRLVLEATEESQGRLTHDAAAAFSSLRSAAAFYVWPADRRAAGDGVAGVLHAKAAIADARTAFVTSANLTGHALTANMELGLLVRGGPVPTRLTSHFDALIAQSVLRKVT